MELGGWLGEVVFGGDEASGWPVMMVGDGGELR